jgi:PAS domain-containing protein
MKKTAGLFGPMSGAHTRFNTLLQENPFRYQLAPQQAETANEQLRESEERFQLTIDEAPIGMALVSIDGRFVRVNRALCEIVSYSNAELTGGKRLGTLERDLQTKFYASH